VHPPAASNLSCLAKLFRRPAKPTFVEGAFCRREMILEGCVFVRVGGQARSTKLQDAGHDQ